MTTSELKPKSSCPLLNEDLLLLMNTHLLQSMNQLMAIQKQNIDGLSSINSEKTQKLIGRIQKDPGVARRMQQLNEINHPQQSDDGQSSPKTPQSQIELSKNRLELSDETLFKKRKLNDGSDQKPILSPASRSEASVESDWSDFQKTPQSDSLEIDESTMEGNEGSSAKRAWNITKQKCPFSGAGAFSKFKINRHAN